MDATGAVIDTDTTDETGAYTVTVTSNTDVRVRVRSELVQVTGAVWNIQVLDNTNANAIYVLNGGLASSGETNTTRNLNAASGWGTVSYTSARAAAPFAILDGIYETVTDIAAVDNDVVFPDLQVLWSINNRAASGSVAAGEIGTSSYTRANGIPTIRILGDADSDTDEYDTHVVVHEFGHYFEDQLSRSDSVGGRHSQSDRLDPRLALSEGFGNAFSGMILDDPVYRDSLGVSQANGFSINVEDNVYPTIGWYSEASVQSILYDIYDSDDDGADTISAGLEPIYTAFTDPDYIENENFTTIFQFIDRVRDEASVDGTVLDAMAIAQDINGAGPVGGGETNTGGRAQFLPIFKKAPVNGASITVCSTAINGDRNKLGVREFIMVNIPVAGSVTMTATKTTGTATVTDPDFNVWEDGRLFSTPDRVADSGVADTETWTGPLDARTYAVEFYDFNNFQTATAADSCFNFAVTQ